MWAKCGGNRWMLGLLLALTAQASAAQTVDQGLVAFYPFNLSLNDLQPPAENGVSTGNPSYAPGITHRALSLDGENDSVRFPGIPANTFASDFSISFFVKLELPNTDRSSLISRLGQCGGPNGIEILHDGDGSGELLFELSGNSPAAVQVATARAPMPAGVWAHVAAVRDGGVARVYVEAQPGADAVLPIMGLGAVGTDVGIGTSPCIGGDDGVHRPWGRIDDLRIYPRALTAAEVELLSRRAQIRVSPDGGSVGGEMRLSASGLVPGRAYQVEVVGDQDREVVLTETATGGSAVWLAAIPAVSPNVEGSVRLSAGFGTGFNLERIVPFGVGSPLGLEVLTQAPQAGKRITVRLDSVPSGSVRLRYGERIVAGPVVLDGEGDGSLSFTAPEDYPASFPAQVQLRAEVIAGRQVARVAAATITVAAPFTGPFVDISDLGISDSLPRPGEKISIGGRIVLGDGASAASIETSAYWISAGGQVTPLSTDSLAIGDDGSYRLDTYPPSLGAMSALIPDGPGRIRLVTKRSDAFGRAEYQIHEGPDLRTFFDLDPQRDITVFVRKPGSGGQPEPLEGAFVVFEGTAPVEPVAIPVEPEQSPWPTPGQVFAGNTRPSIDIRFGGEDGTNQLSASLDQFELPPPVCGTSLYRRYTDVQGRAEFGIAGGPEEPPGNWQDLGMVQYQPDGCSGNGCRISQQLPRTFRISVFTLHLGAGFIGGPGSANIEIPTRFDVSYVPATGVFSFRNLRTGELTEQTGSATLFVDVPLQTGNQNYLSIDDPIMLQDSGTRQTTVPRSNNRFGQWIEFTANVSEFINTPAVKVIRFGHRPTINGSITSAKLFVPNLNTGLPSLLGEFSRLNQVQGCNIQDDGSIGTGETWELRLDNSLNAAWRFPRGVFFRSDAQQRTTCGYIEASNLGGALGRRNLCFEWQEAPAYFNESGGFLTVEDSDMNRVLVSVSGDSLGDASVSTPKAPPLFGEDLDRPPATTTRGTSSRGLFDTITATGTGGAVRNFNGNNPAQFNEPAEGRSEAVNFGDGAVEIEIGRDEFEEILDVTIPLFQWYWGVPEILAAEVFARMRLLAAYYYFGTLKMQDGEERLDLIADAVLAVAILIGVDIDVLFGFIVDAGATITGTIQSEIPLVVENNEPQPIGPCISFRLGFYGYVDPCVLCPTPVIEFDEPDIFNVQDPPNCSFYENRPAGSDFDLARVFGKGGPQFGPGEARLLRRHPALAFDADGNGQALLLGSDNELLAMPIQPAQGAELIEPLSIAPGARQTQLAYYKPGQAIAVWMESALDVGIYVSSDYQTISRNQRVAWSTYDGETWGTKQFLTQPGTGEAHPTLVACPAGEAGCPAGGEVFLAWQRNESGNPRQPRHRVMHATWRPASGWGAITPADSDLGQIIVQQITPTASYVNAKPFLMWTHQTLGDLNDFSNRLLAYRHVGVGPARLESNQLPTAAIGAHIATGPGGSAPEVLLTFLRADEGAGPIGSGLALHIATAQCLAGVCTWDWHRATDDRGRAIYGERPKFARGGALSSIVMRGFRFEGEDAEPVQAGDPIGSILSSGDLFNIVPNYPTGIVRVTPISADGGMHFGHAATYDPAGDAVMTLATTLAFDGLIPLRSILKKAGSRSVESYGKLLAPLGGAPANIELRTLPAVPDLVIESLEADTDAVSPGASIGTLLRIGNRGMPYASVQHGAVRLELRWNSPASAPLASVLLADLDGGAAVDLAIAFTTPVDAHGDEMHVLYASLAVGPQLTELTAANNHAKLEFAGLPTPSGLASQTRPGASVVQLGWDAEDDPRVAGYRVYLEAADGSWLPMGASPNRGFLDITAQFGHPRTYAVSSYSARGIESTRSEPITVMPIQPERGQLFLFRDGFEQIIE